MIKIGLLVAGLSFSFSVSAADIVDVYGLNQRDGAKIIKKYSKDVASIELALVSGLINNRGGDKGNKLTAKLVEKRKVLVDKIAKDNGFLFVDFQTVHYLDNKDLYTTIEVVDKQHPERLRFVKKPTKTNVHKNVSPHKPDLIDAMTDYSNIGTDLLMHNQINFKKFVCPVHHCTAGFDHQKLRPYLAKFNGGAIKEKAFVINTLNHDSDPERRASAAFLVAHFHDPHEIVSILSPHVADNDDGVRNNVMRVIAETIAKNHITDIDVTPFIDALDSTYTTDRNKALYVLHGAADGQAARAVIIQKGGSRLITLMRLKQPNNHDEAYSILKKISGKNFDERDIKSWAQWLSTEKNQQG